MRRFLLATAFAAWSCGAAWADAPSVRVGDHPGFGRIVFEFDAAPAYTVSEQPGQIVLHFPGASTVPNAPRTPRNVLAATGGEGAATIRLAPGTRWRARQVGNRIVIDVLDPPRTAPPRSTSRPNGSIKPVLMLGQTVPTPNATAQADEGAPAPAPVVAVTQEALSLPAPWRIAGTEGRPSKAPPDPVSTTAVPTPMPMPTPPAAELSPAPAGTPSTEGAPDKTAPGGAMPVRTAPPDLAKAADVLPHAEPPGTLATLSGKTVTFPFGPETGAAALVLNGSTILVFDNRRPLDLSALRGDAGWGSAVVQMLPEATLVRLPEPAAGLTVKRTDGGWSATIGAPSDAAPQELQLTPAGLVIPGTAPGRVVVVPAASGRRLLVGTWRNNGSGTDTRRRAPEFSLLPTLLGVAVDPVSDRIGLSARNDGFIVTAEGLELASSSVEPSVAGGRLFEISPGSPDDLMRRLQAQVATAARSGPLGRTPDRLAAAQTMIGLGMGPEAQSLLHAASAADPEASSGDLMTGLAAVSAILAGRPDEAGALDEPRFSGNGEASLWRAVRNAMRDPASTSAAATFAGARRLVDSYPEPLRRRLLPLMAETTARGGQGAAADVLLAASPDDPAFDLARAIRTAATGDVDAALAAYDQVLAGRDLRERARGMVLRTEFALANHRLTPLAAADAMDRAAAAWRNGPAERDARLRASELRAEAGAWRPALEGLRDAASLFPDDRALVREHMSAVFAAMLDGKQPVTPMDLVSLAGEFPDVLPGGEKGVALADRMADALAALDLPKRAGAVLQGLMNRATGPARAALGRRLAATRLEDAEPADALAALDASEVPGITPALAEARALLRARALAATDLSAATAGLAAFGTRAADDLRATMLADAGDWSGARAALNDLLAKTPAAEASPVVLRLATATARLNDPNDRRRLREQWSGKLPPGKDADLFRLLTAEPVRNPSDLPRAAGEIALARSLPR